MNEQEDKELRCILFNVLCQLPYQSIKGDCINCKISNNEDCTYEKIVNKLYEQILSWHRKKAWEERKNFCDKCSLNSTVKRVYRNDDLSA